MVYCVFLCSDCSRYPRFAFVELGGVEEKTRRCNHDVIVYLLYMYRSTL